MTSTKATKEPGIQIQQELNNQTTSLSPYFSVRMSNLDDEGPEDILSIVDQRARRLNLSRSAFLAEAALHFGKQCSNNIKRA